MSRLFQQVIRGSLAQEGIFDFLKGSDDSYGNLHNERMEVLKEMHDLGELRDHEPFQFGAAVSHYALNGVVFPDARMAATALDELGRFAEVWVVEYPKAVAQLTQHVQREIFVPALAGQKIDTLVANFNKHKSYFPGGLRRFLSTKRESRFRSVSAPLPASENFAGDWFVTDLNAEGGWGKWVMGLDFQKDSEIQSPKTAQLAPYRASDVRLVMHAVEKIMDAAEKFPALVKSLEQSVQWLKQQRTKPGVDAVLSDDYLLTVQESCFVQRELEELFKAITKPAEVAIKLCHLSIKRAGK